MKKCFTIFCATFYLSVSAVAQDVSFTASVDKNTVAVGEQFSLVFTLNGGGMGGGKNFKLPDLSKFMVISGPSQASNVQIVNGSVSSSVSYSYDVQPREVGTFTIGPAGIETGGKQYPSQPLQITVVKGGAKPKQPAAGGVDADAQVGDNLFLRAVVDRSRLYVGEQLIVTFKVYTRVSITNYSINKLSGCWPLRSWRISRQPL